MQSDTARQPTKTFSAPILGTALSIGRVLTASYFAATATALLIEPPAQNFVFGMLSPATVALTLFAAAIATLFANPLRAATRLRPNARQQSEPGSYAVRN